jgi:hypothetical protein
LYLISKLKSIMANCSLFMVFVFKVPSVSSDLWKDESAALLLVIFHCSDYCIYFQQKWRVVFCATVSLLQFCAWCYFKTLRYYFKGIFFTFVLHLW